MSRLPFVSQFDRSGEVGDRLPESRAPQRFIAKEVPGYYPFIFATMTFEDARLRSKTVDVSAGSSSHDRAGVKPSAKAALLSPRTRSQTSFIREPLPQEPIR